MPTVSVMVEAGKATASAPLGPALGPLGINIGEVVKQINDKTKEFEGMKVPVRVMVDSATKEFSIQVGSPPMSALIKKEAGTEKASKDPKREFVGNLSLKQAVGIAKKKSESLYSYNLKSSVKEVLGTCNSMGIRVENRRASEVIPEIDSGKYDSLLKEQGAMEETATEKTAAEKKVAESKE